MKLALCFLPDESRCASVAEKMAQAQAVLDFHTVKVLPFAGGAAGCVFTSDRFSKIPLFRENPKGNWLMVAGVPIDKQGNLDKRLAATVDGDHQNAARSLPELDGAFAAVFWDNEHQKLVIVTDFLGMQPLYLFRRNGVTLMATEVKGVTASGLFDVNMDPAGWGSFISFGHTIGSNTLIEGVERVEPARVLVFDPADGWRENPAYWNWPKPRPEMTIENVDTGQVVELLRQDVRAYVEHVDPGTLLLSGGFDSRIILSLMRMEGLVPEAVLVAHPDQLMDAEGKLAVRVAKRFNLNYRFMTPAKSFYSSEQYLDYMVMNEASTSSLYLFIAQISSFLVPEMQAVWEGMFTGYGLKSGYQARGGFENYLAKVQSFQKQRRKSVFQIFSRSRAEQIYEAFTESLKAETSKYPNDGFGVLEFVLRNRGRNRIAPNSLKVYANFALPFTPGCSKAFWELSGSMPHAIKADNKLYMKIFLRHFPEAASIPFISGGNLCLMESQGIGPWTYAALNRLEQLPAVKVGGKLFRRLTTGSWQYWPESELASRVISRIDPTHPDLNADEVQKLQRTRPGSLDVSAYWTQRFLFYWQICRWVAQGQLTIRNKEILSSELTSSH